MPNESADLATSRWFWIITSYRDDRVEVLTFDPDGNGGFVAVFSIGAEAEAFLGLLEHFRKRDWRIRETSKGELVSILLGPCAAARRVALDPPPPSSFGTAMTRLVSVNKERFMRQLLEERRGATGELVLA